MSGLLIAGTLHQVPNVTIIGPHETKWAHLGIGDSRTRRGMPTMVILHTTKGAWPQVIKPGKGPVGRAERTAEFWIDDPTYSGAHIVCGSDGVSACLADLANTQAHHATVSNPYAIGIEIYQEAGGVIFEAALEAAVRICNAISDALLIQRAVPRRPYANKPIARLARDGGKGCYGFFGHRDNTVRRGRGDPGEAVFDRLEADGYEVIDFETHEDLAIGARRQRKLLAMGERLAVDGFFGPQSVAAMRRRGFRDGRELDSAVEAQ